MAIRATFIGLNKYVDPEIRELTGACRDATALWALFADSIPNIEATLLVDHDATLERIRHVLADTLGAASQDDIVFLTFAGHGTHDHSLVAYNTAMNALSATTLPMAELATAFRNTKAKAVICILDCCFSGGAPARVLEDSPVPRAPTSPVNDVAGKGRILIAASNVDEEAWELPGTGHGILTKALIDIMCDEPGSLSIPDIMGALLDRVRVEAARIGVTQTPVLLGYVEGGLVLPKIKRGERFLAAFPEFSGAHTDGQIGQLAGFGVPPSIVAEWNTNFPSGLNELQIDAVNQGRVLDGESLLVIAPTSSGKTFVGEMAAARAVAAGRKAIFLLPYRALVNEKYEQFDSVYGKAGMRVVRCTGDYTDQTNDVLKGRYDLGVLTYEMFLNLAVGNPGILNQLGLVVLDEAQFITDPNRGISVELLLTLLITARERGDAPQLVTLSAVIGDINGFDAWLGCRKLIATRRPVPLVEGVIDRSGTFQFVDETGKSSIQQLLPAGSVLVRKNKASAQDLIVPLVRQLVRSGERVIVFRNQRGPAQGCAKYLADDLGLPAATSTLQQLPNNDLSSTSIALRDCLAGGTAFHNTNLTREERALVERAFRNPESGIAVLVATTTVAAGINTPASTVILAEQEFIGDDGRPFTVAEYKNIAGRAGRLGHKERGRAIIYAETPFERERLFRRYVMGDVERIESSFQLDELPTWIVRLLAQVKKIPKDDVPRLLANTYGGYLAGMTNPNWKAQIEQQLGELVGRMVAAELLEEDASFLRLTLLGRACGRSALSFDSALRLVELLRATKADHLTAEKLMAILQALPESAGGFTPMMKKGASEHSRPREASERYGSELVRVLQRQVDDEFDYFARCKRAAILWDWINGDPVEVIETRYSPNPYQGRIQHGDIRRFADATRFHLRPAYQILTILFPEAGPIEEAMDRLMKQLELGIPAEAVGLVDLPLPLSRGELLSLSGNNIRTPKEFWAADATTLRRLLGGMRFAELADRRPVIGEQIKAA
jgi:helicase